MKLLKNSKIIVCGIVRDAEKGLKKNIPIINRVCSCFKDYRVFIYENDSKDATKDILMEWHSFCPDKVLVSLNNTDSKKTIPSESQVVSNPFFSAKRILKMVKLRNEYMNFIEENKWDADYLMVVDLDVSQLFFDGILDSFNSHRNWDAVVSYGYSLSPKLRWRYHDTYALTLYGDENEIQTESQIKLYAEKFAKLKCDDEWIRIFSGFGGLAIYKYEAVKGLKYKLIPNLDEKVEVRCEHYSIYKQMKDRGYDQVFLNPAMRLKYQSVTFRIVLSSLLRKIRSLM